MSINMAQGQMKYNNPHWAVSSSSVVQQDRSSIGDQIVLDVYIRKAIEESLDTLIFTQLSSSTPVPKNSGKSLKKHRYIPILDDRNVNDQGINSNGEQKGAGNKTGNLFGGSMDFGTISQGLPVLSEVGGRVNRVGMTRTVVEAKLKSLGFFIDFTEESLSFDDDSQLFMHLAKESLHAAQKINEMMLGAQLVEQGQRVHSGNKTDIKQYSGDAYASADRITYDDLQNLAVTLKKNQAPKILKAMTGTRLIDTKIIPNAYVMVIPADCEVMFRNFHDHWGVKAFIGVEHYAAGTNTLTGEIGTVGQFRIVVAPYLPHWQAVGTEKGTSATNAFQTSAGFAGNINNSSNTDTNKQYYDVAPCIALTTEAYSALSFKSGSTGMPFMIRTKMPGMETVSSDDPFGRNGIHSIQWYYGMIMDRPEWVIVQPTLIEKAGAPTH